MSLRDETSSFSDIQARRFQQKLIIDAIDRFGSQEKLSQMLQISQQSISSYKKGTKLLTLPRLIRIAKIMGMESINVTWN